MRYGSEDNIQYKINFEGIILSVQPRSNVWRYRLDNRTHTLTGYNVFLERTTDENLTADGKAGTDRHKFAVAISEKQQEKLRFHIGDEISGTAWTKKYPKLEYADYYRAGALKKSKTAEPENRKIPPCDCLCRYCCSFYDQHDSLCSVLSDGADESILRRNGDS